MVETQYIDGPNRLLGGIALIIREQYGDDAGAWIDIPNARMGGLSPRQFLKFDDLGTWYVVSRMFSRPVDLSDIDYPPKLIHPADPLEKPPS